MNEILTPEMKAVIAQLGEIIKADPRHQAIRDCIEEYERSEELNNLIAEYNMQQNALADVYGKNGEADEALRTVVQSRIDALYDLILSVYEQSHLRVTTGALNDVLGEAMMRVQPPTDKGRRLKIFYMTQTQVAPPTFVLFCNMAELFHFSYQRYIENCLRETYGFKGTPIKMIIKQKGDDPEINVRGKKDKKDDQENEEDGWEE